MEQATRFIGMDVRKDTIVVAITATAEAAAYGTFPNTAAGLEKLLKRLRQTGGGPLKFCYERVPAVKVFTLPLPRWAKTAWWSLHQGSPAKAVSGKRTTNATLHAAGRRYQASHRGRIKHAQRSRRYRARQNKVTHHGSPPGSIGCRAGHGSSGSAGRAL